MNSLKTLKDASARAEKKESDAAVKKEGEAVKGEICVQK